jgi:hypothetical protein
MGSVRCRDVGDSGDTARRPCLGLGASSEKVAELRKEFAYIKKKTARRPKRAGFRLARFGSSDSYIQNEAPRLK